MHRRRFIKDLSAGALLLFNGTTLTASGNTWLGGKRPILRFAVASDCHFGQKNTPYSEYLDAAVGHMNERHNKTPFDFAVINGHIVHDDRNFFSGAKKALDGLRCPYFVTQGNHDHATPEQWESAWGMPVNIAEKMGDSVLLMASTSDEKGTYLPPDLGWLRARFDEYRDARHILLFIHIPPVKWTANAIESTGFQELAARQANLRAVFHGHEHDQYGIKWKDGVPYLFDSHLGGNWGTSFRGYRIVELYRNGAIRTWMMDPLKSLEEADIPSKKNTTA
jgi:hypothetical protein